jgi:hypothetical protein
MNLRGRTGQRGRGIRHPNYVIIASLIVLLSTLWPVSLSAAVKATFLYQLSDFGGPVRYDSPRVSVDSERKETSVLYQNLVRVFNESGMEIYRFGDDLSIGTVVDVSVERSGDILLLAYGDPPVYGYRIVRCNFRGEPVGTVTINNVPDQLHQFSPHRMISRAGRLYFLNSMDLKVIVTREDGTYEKSYDLFALLELKEKDRGNIEIAGFSVADDDSILFTIPVLFSAYRLYPDGRLISFGRPGSAPGKFNITGGIVLDSRDNYLVVDRLKSTVMVFDKNQEYVTQFGYRGPKAGNLIAPNEIAIDKDDKVYVTQGVRRGISVFKVSRVGEEP